jgi:actin-related protein
LVLVDLTMEAHPALVIDNGTRYMKVGHAGEEHPQAIFPTVIGRPRVPTPAYWNSLPGTTTETYPIDRGLVVNRDALEQIWTETFEDKLKVVASEHNVLLTVQAFIQRQHRDIFAEIMFETFNVRGMQIAQQAACGLFGLGCETGLVVNMGDGVTSVVPIYQGIMLDCGVQNLWVGGGDLTHYTMKLLNERNYGLKTIGDRQMCQDIKEKH